MTTVTKSALLAAVEKTAFRVSLLLRSATSPQKKAIGTWSVAETANHLAYGYPFFADSLQGKCAIAANEVDAHNDQLLAEDPERDLDVLADRVEAGAQRYIEVARSLGEDELVEVFSGMLVPASAVTATLLGEVLVHGYDIASAERLPWRLDPAHVILTQEELVPVMVHFVDKEAAAGLDAGFEVRLWGGSTTYWYFDNGRLTVETSPILPVDCRISAEPVTFLLMSYNRIGPTKPVLTGKVRISGRRPWLATKLGGVFKT